MEVLVAYATKYGSTAGIADTIAERLRVAGLDVEVAEAGEVHDIERFDAYVIGSATYIGHWRQDAAELVRRHAELLAARPTWLFSSGPLGTSETDARGRPLREVAAPEEVAEFEASIAPRGHVVFFGALVPSKLEFRDRTVRRLPVGRELLPAGDFRDLAEVEAWSDTIAADLAAGAEAE